MAPPKEATLAASTSTATSTSTTEQDTTVSVTVQDDDDAGSMDATNLPLVQYIQQHLQNSWLQQLSTETSENYVKSKRFAALPDDYDENQMKRPIYNGHYVRVLPTPLPNPRLILSSSNVATELLGLSETHVSSPEFLQWVSGDGPSLGLNDTWATPYALSIAGTRYTSNCPYGTGDGYGDGRAISLGELHNHEIQLKGSGPTVFHRGADGRAVLRSSIREFLASESMHYMGVPTTRALSLVVSETETIRRPWYSENTNGIGSNGNKNGLFRTTPATSLPSLDDPRLAQYSPDQRKQILAELRQRKADPDVLVSEPAAIATRVAPSFVRVGHLDLYARRAEKISMKTFDQTQSRWNIHTPEWHELEQMVWHACYREYRDIAYDPYRATNDIAAAATVFLHETAKRLSSTVAQWIRVGFSQGNFNADNCLVGGRTMDYGPFGFMEEYHPLFAKWTGTFCI